MKALSTPVPNSVAFLVVGSMGAAIAMLISNISNGPPTRRVDVPRMVAAAKAYAEDFKAGGRAVPESVDLETLMARGLLSPGDVSGFQGMAVSVSLSPDRQGPQVVLMQARIPEGGEFVALGDGSVHEQR